MTAISRSYLRDDGELSCGDDRDSRMEVLCSCDGQYLPHAATMLCSLLEHNSVVRIHLFCGPIANRELAKLKSLVEGYRSELIVYDVTAIDLQELSGGDPLVAPYYRLLAPRLLPVGVCKLLYLDCDIIIRRSLTELWSTNVTGHALAAVPDLYEAENGRALGLPAGVKYFNSGVLLINLCFWRQYDVSERVISLIRSNPEKMGCWDQDGLNAALIDQWIELPGIWNAQITEWRAMPLGAEKDPAIVHFLTQSKPWCWSNKHPFKREYREYRLKTPWRRYKEEGKPHFVERFARSIRRIAWAVVPSSVRQWLRSIILVP